MYVLHHADKPQIYADLPDNPRISPIVEFWKGVDQICRAWPRWACMAAIGVRAPPRRRARTRSRARTKRSRQASWPGGRIEPMTRHYDVEPGDASIRATRSPSTATRPARASTTGSRRRAWCCSRCPGWRCSTRAVLPHRPVRRRPERRARIHPWIGVVLFFSFVGLFFRFWRANLWKRDRHRLAGALSDVLTRPRGAAARDRQVQCRPEVRCSGRCRS